MFKFDLGDGIFFNDVEEITFSPEVVAFSIEVFPWGFAELAAELGLLLFDPGQLGNDESTNSF